MSTTRELLVYGSDALLLQTRRFLLEGAGFEVWTTTKLAEVRQFCETRDIRLLILCHSLALEESERAIEVVRSLRPSVNHLLLTANRFELHLGARAELLSIFEGPEALLATVHEILKTADNPDRHIRSSP